MSTGNDQGLGGAGVVTRIPPSPTGRLHIGTARTALFNYLYARHEGGRVVFRSEDTDRARSKKEFEDEIIEGLEWLGLSWDGEITRQSARTERYKELLHKAIADGHAYLSKEPAKDDPGREVEVVRLKNPGREVVFEDLVRGPINTHTGELGDFVIARSIDDPLYHFAVVVDDLDAGVTHVIRGEDHISNTARQILIQEALGAPRPQYAHLPLILDEKRAKLSKRNGATSLMDYRAEGFLPEAMVNYLALLGWNPGGEREDFSLSELVEEFSLAGIQKSGAAWDRAKLLSVNQRWMRKLNEEQFLARLAERPSPEKSGEAATAFEHFAGSSAAKQAAVIILLKERAQTLSGARAMLEGELKCLFEKPALEKAQLLAKEAVTGSTSGYLMQAKEALENLPADSTADAIKAALMPLADANPKEKGGRGAVLWPLRYALSGQEKSPDPFTLVSILGKEESLSRITTALSLSRP
jgi:glutamyl-tRNA synthetase